MIKINILENIVEYLNVVKEKQGYKEGTLEIKHINHNNKSIIIMSYADEEGNTCMRGMDYGNGESVYSIGPVICNGCHRLVFERIEFNDKDDLINKLNLDFIGGFDMNKIFCTKCMNRIESDEDIINKLAPWK